MTYKSDALNEDGEGGEGKVSQMEHNMRMEKVAKGKCPKWNIMFFNQIKELRNQLKVQEEAHNKKIKDLTRTLEICQSGDSYSGELLQSSNRRLWDALLRCDMAAQEKSEILSILEGLPLSADLRGRVLASVQEVTRRYQEVPRSNPTVARKFKSPPISPYNSTLFTVQNNTPKNITPKTNTPQIQYSPSLNVPLIEYPVPNKCNKNVQTILRKSTSAPALYQNFKHIPHHPQIFAQKNPLQIYPKITQKHTSNIIQQSPQNIPTEQIPENRQKIIRKSEQIVEKIDENSEKVVEKIDQNSGTDDDDMEETSQKIGEEIDENSAQIVETIYQNKPKMIQKSSEQNIKSQVEYADKSYSETSSEGEGNDIDELLKIKKKNKIYKNNVKVLKNKLIQSHHGSITLKAAAALVCRFCGFALPPGELIPHMSVCEGYERKGGDNVEGGFLATLKYILNISERDRVEVGSFSPPSALSHVRRSSSAGCYLGAFFEEGEKRGDERGNYFDKNNSEKKKNQTNIISDYNNFSAQESIPAPQNIDKFDQTDDFIFGQKNPAHQNPNKLEQNFHQFTQNLPKHVSYLGSKQKLEEPTGEQGGQNEKMEKNYQKYDKNSQECEKHHQKYDKNSQQCETNVQEYDKNIKKWDEKDHKYDKNQPKHHNIAPIPPLPPWNHQIPTSDALARIEEEVYLCERIQVEVIGVRMEMTPRGHCSQQYSIKIVIGNATWTINRMFKEIHALQIQVHRLFPCMAITSRTLAIPPHKDRSGADVGISEERLQRYLQALVGIRCVRDSTTLRAFLGINYHIDKLQLF